MTSGSDAAGTGGPAGGRADPARILVVHPAFLGDTVFLGPAVRALKARWPDARIALVVTPRGAPAAELLPGCDEVVVFDKRRADRGVSGAMRVGARLRALSPDLALVSHPSPRSGAIAWLSGAPRRVGYAPLCNERLREPRGRPFVDLALRLAAVAGAPSEDRSLRLLPPAGRESYAGEVLRGASGPVVGLVPGAEWATKRWPAAAYGALAADLAGRGASVLLLGGPSERPLCAEVAAAARVPVRDTAGNSIAEALALLARCDLVVGGDTGLVHCARGLGRPTLMLFGPTDPGRHLIGPRERAMTLDLECQPCHDHGPRRCPLGHHHCMTLLSAAVVAQAARALLDAPRG